MAQHPALPTGENTVLETGVPSYSSPPSSVNSSVSEEESPENNSSDQTAELSNQTSEKRHVKKTCEACVRSKIRCDGGNPCQRCSKRGIECVFLLELKRGRRPGPLLKGYQKRRDTSTPKRVPRKKHDDDEAKKIKAESTVSQQQSVLQLQSMITSNILQSLPLTAALLNIRDAPNYSWNAFAINPLIAPSPISFGLPNYLDRRIIRTLFALFKHSRQMRATDSVRPKWFEEQFIRLWKFLDGKVPREDHNLFSRWLLLNGFAAEGDAKLGTLPKPTFAAHDGHFAEEAPLPVGPYLGTVRILPNQQMACDTLFTQSFGHTAASLIPPSYWPQLGTLPWGAEVFSVLACKEDEAFNVVRHISSRLVSVGWPKSAQIKATVRRSVQLAHREGMVVPCSVVIDVAESSTEGTSVSIGFFLNFQPMNIKYEEADLGPWTGSVTTPSWLAALLSWM